MKIYHFININANDPFSVEKDVLDFIEEANTHNDLFFKVVGILGQDGREYNNETIFDIESAYYRIWAAHQPTQDEEKAFYDVMTKGLEQLNSKEDCKTWGLAAQFCLKQNKLIKLGSDIFSGSCYQGMYLWEGITRIDRDQGDKRYIAILEVDTI